MQQSLIACGTSRTGKRDPKRERLVATWHSTEWGPLARSYGQNGPNARPGDVLNEPKQQPETSNDAQHQRVRVTAGWRPRC